MEVTHSRIDVAAMLAANQRPAAIVDRAPGESWLVSYDAIRMESPIQWANTVREAEVFIPMARYILNPEADLALAYIMQLGIRVSIDVGRPVKRLHLATGFPVDDVTDPHTNERLHFRYWLGFGIVLE
jgi:hypothetical protein